MRVRVIAILTTAWLATSAVAEPLNYDACEKIQDSREYAHCIATLGSGAGKKSAAPEAQPTPAPQPEASEAPEVRREAGRKVRGGKVVVRAAPRAHGRVRVEIRARQKGPQRLASTRHAAAKPTPHRGKSRR